MVDCAKDGTCLDTLISIAMPICKEAELRCPRAGRGRPPEIPDWVMAVLIMVVTFKKKKSKSAQFRWIDGNRDYLAAKLGDRLPRRSAYFDRFRRGHVILTEAIQALGEKAVRYGWADASAVSVDKSLMAARGPKWWRSDRRKKRIPKGLRGVDCDSQWGRSSYHGWVQGYSFEVLVSSGKNGVVWPLLASTDTADISEHQSFESKIPRLPNSARFVLADAGYDSNRAAEAIEWRDDKRTGVRFLCPQNKRGHLPSDPPIRRSTEGKRDFALRKKRAARRDYFRRPSAQKQYRLRSQTVEPFNEWFKSAFDFSRTVWHRGLENNKTQTLAAIFAYQVALRYNRIKNNHNGQIRPILDRL